MKPALLCAAVLLASSCGSNQPPPKKTVAEAPKPIEYFHVDPATAGTIKGKIRFRGAKPSPAAISMESDAGCRQAHAGKPVYDESVIVGRGGTLGNVFVYIKTGLEGKKFEPPKEAVALDQHGCLFVPRVMGIETGQMLDVKNSDSVSHNIHPMPTNNREFNQQQSPGAPDIEHKFPRVDVMIPVKCNVHSWMRAYIGVVDHPYFYVTGPDGAFELKNVPPGDYMLSFWHEKLGEHALPVHLPPATVMADVVVDYKSDEMH